jgi:hypothetical protein
MKINQSLIISLLILFSSITQAKLLVGETKVSIGVSSGQAKVVIPISYNATNSLINPSFSIVANSNANSSTLGAGFILAGIKSIQRCSQVWNIMIIDQLRM